VLGAGPRKHARPMRAAGGWGAGGLLLGGGWLAPCGPRLCLSVILVAWYRYKRQEILDWLVFASLSRQRGPVDPTVPEYYGATMMLLLP
jgi:hypothetical protein